MVRLTIVGLLAFAVALAGTAYAEVQSIKVSGDLDLKWILNHNHDLKQAQDNLAGGPGVGRNSANSNNDDAEFFLSTTHVRVDADLTDNVSATVKLLNQRVWDAHSTDESIHLDNAYVVLREFLYSPLTVIAGRQNLQYGDGFIVGSGILADPEGIFGVPDSFAIHAGGIGGEHSAYNAYDAIRLIFDFAPLTVEGLVAKMNETGATNDDSDLYGLYVTYKLDRWDAQVEPYWFWKNNESDAVPTNDSLVTTAGADAIRTYERNDVHTVGLRLAGSPVENLRLTGEGAFQFGHLTDTTPVSPGLAASGQQQERARDGWAANVRATYDWVTVPWTPTTGIGWMFTSGEEASTEQGPARVGVSGLPTTSGADKFNAWDPVFRGLTHTYVSDYLSGRDAPPNLYTTVDTNDTAATTNRHHIYGDVTFKPLQDVTAFVRYTHARFDEAPRAGRSTHAGDEVDAKLSYAYTEDVNFSTWGGWFIPGSYYDEPESNTRSNDMAWTTGVGGSVKF